MERETDLRRVLADEVRAAIAETAAAPADRLAAGDPDTEDVRTLLERASDALTPSVPPGSSLEPVKRLAIRALRFLWRNQSTFNALSVDASRRLAGALERLRVHTDRRLDELARRAGIQETRLMLAESGAAAGRPPAPGAASPPAEIPAGVYALFEERFRGSPSEIAERQRDYLKVLSGIPGAVLDVGCGRGEFLSLLSAAGVAASGIESNPVCVSACRSAGLVVEEAEALEALARREPGSLGAVVSFQVVEHWSPGTIFRFLREARRVLAPGGVLVAETVNTDSLTALRSFYLDPTHVRPVPPEALRFLAEAAGFSDARIEWRSLLPAAERLEESSPNDRKLNALLYGPQDYAIVARVAAAP